MKNDLTVLCPHCNLYVLIHEINCAIFRHGVYKKDNQQMNPHASKEECDKCINENLIIGCGKPFKLVLENNVYNAIICDYI
jgi:hypothetical protein